MHIVMLLKREVKVESKDIQTKTLQQIDTVISLINGDKFTTKLLADDSVSPVVLSDDGTTQWFAAMCEHVNKILSHADDNGP
jgi:hypothetical protein